MNTKERFNKIEKLSSTYVVGTDAAIERLQLIVRELTEICKTQQNEIDNKTNNTYHSVE